MKYKIGLLACFTFILGGFGFAQISFYKQISNFECIQIIQTQDKGYVATGASDQITFLKFDSIGNQLWAKYIPDFFSHSAVETEDNDLFICGTENINGHDRGMVVRTHANGEIVWAKSYYLPSAIQPSEGASEIIQTDDGNFLLFWIAQSGWEQSFIYLVKIDPNGEIIWAKKYNDYQGVKGKIVSTVDGGFFFCSAHSHFDSIPDGSMVTKITSEGELHWSKIIEGMNSATSVVETSDNGCIVAGDKLIRLNSNGDIIWSKNFPSYGRDVVKTDEGEFLVVANLGWSLQSSLKKIDLDGNIIFSNNFLDTPMPLFEVKYIPNGGVILNGYYPGSSTRH